MGDLIARDWANSTFRTMLVGMCSDRRSPTGPRLKHPAAPAPDAPAVPCEPVVRGQHRLPGPDHQAVDTLRSPTPGGFQDCTNGLAPKGRRLVDARVKRPFPPKVRDTGSPEPRKRAILISLQHDTDGFIRLTPWD